MTVHKSDALEDQILAMAWGRGERSVAWRHALSLHLTLPAIRGVWPLSSFDENGDAYDLSGQGRTLTYNGNGQYGNELLVPYHVFDGAGDFLERADEAGLDITGNETHVVTAQRGFTVGIWAHPTTTGNLEYLFSKYGAAGSRSWRIVRNASDHIRFSASTDGTNMVASGGASTIADQDEWAWCCGRFQPGTGVYTTVNDVTAFTADAALLTMFNSNASLLMSGHTAGASALFTGRLSLGFMAAMWYPDFMINGLFQHTRDLFGV